jgi:hypothetical protein
MRHAQHFVRSAIPVASKQEGGIARDYKLCDLGLLGHVTLLVAVTTSIGKVTCPNANIHTMEPHTMQDPIMSFSKC